MAAPYGRHDYELAGVAGGRGALHHMGRGQWSQRQPCAHAGAAARREAQGQRRELQPLLAARDDRGHPWGAAAGQRGDRDTHAGPDRLDGKEEGPGGGPALLWVWLVGGQSPPASPPSLESPWSSLLSSASCASGASGASVGSGVFCSGTSAGSASRASLATSAFSVCSVVTWPCTPALGITFEICACADTPSAATSTAPAATVNTLKIDLRIVPPRFRSRRRPRRPCLYQRPTPGESECLITARRRRLGRVIAASALVAGL